jgi:hypothetical protein
MTTARLYSRMTLSLCKLDCVCNIYLYTTTTIFGGA